MYLYSIVSKNYKSEEFSESVLMSSDKATFEVADFLFDSDDDDCDTPFTVSLQLNNKRKKFLSHSKEIAKVERDLTRHN